RLST
ncbi:tonB dependent receptor family protein, partial [Vibrio parahaemolyticus VPTS-2010]